MGLHTDYLGHVRIDPPLTGREVDVVRGINRTRHDDRPLRLAEHPSDNDDGNNDVRPGAPGLWCPLTCGDSGDELFWDGIEKPYGMTGWLAWWGRELDTPSPQLAALGLDGGHVLDGSLVGRSQETGRLFLLQVIDGVLTEHTLIEAPLGSNEYGELGLLAQERARSQRLRDRQERYDRAIAADRLLQTGG